jgi:hypothetical protein
VGGALGLACAGAGASITDGGLLEIGGQWREGGGANHEIDAQLWRRDASSYHLDCYDNAGRVLIARNDGANPINPDKWSRFDWTVEGEMSWHCHTSNDGETVAKALGVMAADASEPQVGGCGCNALDPFGSLDGQRTQRGLRR